VGFSGLPPPRRTARCNRARKCDFVCIVDVLPHHCQFLEHVIGDLGQFKVVEWGCMKKLFDWKIEILFPASAMCSKKQESDRGGNRDLPNMISTRLRFCCSPYPIRNLVRRIGSIRKVLPLQGRRCKSSRAGEQKYRYSDMPKKGDKERTPHSRDEVKNSNELTKEIQAK
jgi:hypothetical protein